MSFGTRRASSPPARQRIRHLSALSLAVALGVGGLACSSSGSSAGQQAAPTTIVVATTDPTGPSTSLESPSTSPPSETTTAPTGSASGPAQTGNSVATSVPAGAADLLPPSGTFLSSHTLSLGGGSVPDRGRSVCHTSPGATCVIEFTMGAVTRSLPARQVAGDGSTSWDWSPAEIGLTRGHWDVRITASSGSQKHSVDEAIGLEVV